jgi:alcohol dehydrogenase
VLLGLAMGAERVIAAARTKASLDDLVRGGGDRVIPVALTGDVDVDAKSLKAAAGDHGGHFAFDQVGRAGDPNSTLAALKSLRRGGRLVLMGSMTVPLPLPYAEMLANDWEVIGNFMYRPDAFQTLVALVRSGQLDLGLVRVSTFGLRELPEALERAANMRGLDCTVINMNPG